MKYLAILFMLGTCSADVKKTAIEHETEWPAFPSFSDWFSWPEFSTMFWPKVSDVFYKCALCQPEQVHIAFGEKINDVVITWSTMEDPGNTSIVKYGIGHADKAVEGTKKMFTDGGAAKRQQCIHTVVLKDLKHDTRYVYHAGSVRGWSSQFTFKVPPAGQDWEVRAAIYGDMGNTNAWSLSYLQEDVDNQLYDLILHVGDFAYDFHSEEGEIGNRFMRQLEPIAANVQYMVCPGNHEESYNFSHYRNRFRMPGTTEGMYYSFDLGPIHFIYINTEVFYSKLYTIDNIRYQHEWLTQDLKEATKQENRSKRPWIIVMGHRPMFCSNDGDDCDKLYLPNRVGVEGKYALEPLIKDYGVDLVVWAHEHSYERSWPVYNFTVHNGTQSPYVNYNAPIHIITGSAGCQEASDGFKGPPPAWSAFRTWQYGYTKFTCKNKTHIYIEQVDVENAGKIIDNFWIVRENHGPYKI